MFPKKHILILRTIKVNQTCIRLKILQKLLDVSVIDFLSGDSITVNQTNNEIAVAQNYAPITSSEKLIEQYEQKLKDKDAEIVFLKQLLDKKTSNFFEVFLFLM